MEKSLLKVSLGIGNRERERERERERSFLGVFKGSKLFVAIAVSVFLSGFFVFNPQNVFAAHTPSNTWDVNNTAYADDTGCVELTRHCSTIQAAINAASAGDTIQVVAGTYMGKIVINKSVILKGPNFGISPNTGVRVAEAIITGTDVADPIIEMTSGDLTGLTIDGFTVSNVTTVGQQQVIHLITDGDNIAIRNNRFLNNSGRIFVSTPPGGPREGLVIADNLIDGMTQDNQAGMQLFTMNNCQITNNVVKNTTYGGIQLGSATICTISGNTVQNVPRSGIAVDNNSDITIQNNSVTNAGNGVGAPATVIAGDDLTENGGITIYNPDQIDVTITDNILTGNFNGIAIRNDAGQALGSGITVNFNGISGSVNRGADNAASSGILNATNNWWGASTGPVHTSNPVGSGNAVSNNVSFAPWCTDSACVTTAVANIVSVNPNTVDSSFTPQINSTINRGNTTYIGRTTSYTGPALGVDGDTIKWRVTIAGPAALESGMVDLDEVGFNDPGGDPENQVQAFHYPFSNVGDNLVALGSCDAVLPSGHVGGEICTTAVGFSLDPNDVFTNADKIVFYSRAPNGDYTITYELVNTADSVVLGSYVVNVQIVTSAFESAPPPPGAGGGGGAITPTPTPAPTAAVTTPPVGQALGVATFQFTQSLKAGSRGNDVVELQKRLTAEGVYFGPVTGYFGPLTEKGVRAFQEKYGVAQVGVVGPLTRAKLNVGQVSGAATSAEAAAIQTKIGELQTQLVTLLQKLVEALQAQLK